MKNKNTIIIVNIVLITVAIALAIFLVVLKNDNNEVVKNAENNFNYIVENVEINIDDNLMTEYVSKDLGFKLKHYNELTRVSETNDADSMYKSAAMFRESGNEGISILIGNISKDTTLAGYLNANINTVIDTNGLTKDDVVVVKEGVKLGDLDAFKLRYKMEDINIYQIIAIKDSKEYVITYSAEDAYYDKQKADNMFSTFEFLN